MRDILAFYGYVTLVAGLGAAAMDIARQKRPDLILLDIQLPDMAGTEVAGRLKADPRTRATPIVAVTAFAMPGDRERFIGSGCDDYIAKPISIGAILAIVERYTTRPGSGQSSR
jgi:two-component system, cell cycle response regulator DivK